MRNRMMALKDAGREFVMAFISMLLAFISLYQFGSNCGASSITEMLSSYSGDATFIDFALLTLTNAIMGIEAAESLDDIANTKQYQRADRAVKRAYLSARSCVFAQKFFCMAVVVFIYFARFWLPCFLVCFIASLPIFFLFPYYRILFKRFFARLEEFYVGD